MRHIGWKVVAGLGFASLLALAPPARAQGASTGDSSSASGQSGATATATTQEVSGKVQKYDKDAKQLTLDNSKTVKLSDKTQVTRNGQPATAADIHEGDDVRATFAGNGSSGEAVMIDLGSKTRKPGGSGK